MTTPKAVFLKSASRWIDLPTDGKPETAFIGRSNVGKSSLINMLVERKALAHTSSTPGKTQTLNFYTLNEVFYLVDLPGFGYARTSKTNRFQWAKLIEQYLNEREELRLVFHLIDSRFPPTDLDCHVLEWMKGKPLAYIILLTKTDKLNQKEKHHAKVGVQKVLDELQWEVPIIMTSSEKRIGKREIWDYINNFLEIS